MINHYDVIIIGTGAGGGTLAYRLAGSGKRILLLERGDFIPREKQNWDATTVFAEGKYTTMERWYDRKGKLFQPGNHYFVGGNTKFFGAVLLRMRQEDFGEVHHYGGISPAWPISYDEMEPYYTLAEQIYHVRGARGEDPTEPAASTPYPYPAISHEPRIQMLADALQGSGYHPFHLPMGVRLNEKLRHKSLCIRCETCDGFPCLVNAKSDAHTMCVNPALEHDNVQLVTNAKVTKLETDASGRMVTGVVVERDGQMERYSGDIVVVSAGAVNSAVLLLKSANDKHPNGLANRSGVVGRHYMAHHNTAFLALSGVPNATVFQKTLGVNDFYYGSADWKYPMGHIQMLGKSTKDLLAAEAPIPAPGFTFDWMAQHAIDFWLTTEDLPHPDNRVTINRQGEITLDYQITNGEAHKRLVNKLKAILHTIHCTDKMCYCDKHIFPRKLLLDRMIPLAGVAHQCGTVRFGDDPQSSALDVNCKAHDLDNLYVVDSSFFVSSSAVNPALTIMANALRVGDHLLERLGVTASMMTPMGYSTGNGMAAKELMLV
ncbi:MAG: GMC family oxidoreductase [Caldilinea sp. CFX5]|nr:GMC family oxidoreductase [Caldilinea sp. CFX5]